jgi:hypothetical protein
MIMVKPADGKKFRGLITYILCQLKGTSNSIFLHFIQDLHVQYQEGKLPKYNPMKLVLEVEDKIRVLKHAEVWETASTTNDVPAMALNTTASITDQLKDFQAHHITAELKRLSSNTKPPPNDHDSGHKDGKSRSKFQHQDWMFVPPNRLSETKSIQGRSYNWCTKCNKGQGQWVQAHTSDTHQDGFRLALANDPTLANDPLTPSRQTWLRLLTLPQIKGKIVEALVNRSLSTQTSGFMTLTIPLSYPLLIVSTTGLV